MSELIAQVSGLLPALLEQTGVTLWLVALSLLFGGTAGLVVGTALYVTRKGGVLQQPVVFWVLNVLVNTFRPIPFIIFLAAMQPIARLVIGTGIGNNALIFALSLAASFAIGRIVEQNLLTVSPGVIEAAKSRMPSQVQVASG